MTIDFFCLLFFALGGNPISKKSESPEEAKPGHLKHPKRRPEHQRKPKITQTCQSGINQAFPKP
ncbi:hypothetical protein PSEUDO8Z_60363 [Pseudomonas sp. 8Z]|nr:hypothetical protein PSEUDO8Z_60363 [Pseudomonas sp. 8Z]